MVAGTHVKVLTAAALFAAEIALAMILLAVAPVPSGAQFFFDNRFPSQNYTQRGLFNWFAPVPPPPQQQHQHQLERAFPPMDYSKAPAPKTDPKAGSAVTTPILVL